MGCSCVVGLQWGDEAKGKIVDILSDQHDFVVRYNGGANAGHTVVHGPKTYKLSLLPTGVLNPAIGSIIGNGVVLFPPRFREEVDQVRAGGIPVGANLRVSAHAHVIFPYHLEEERLSEQGDSRVIGTTGRGIGPCYQDKVSRRHGIRVQDLLDPAVLRERLEQIVPRKNRILQALAGPDQQARSFCVEALLAEYQAHGEYLRPFVCDTFPLLDQALRSGRKVLFEAAQGSLLDIDHGTYPYVTSSNSTLAGIWSGSGVSARKLTRVIGVLKAYTTRVGRGPFPTELTDGPEGVGERIRRIGREYGTVTGRPRRVGWFDVVAARYSARVNDVDELAIMLLDVLSGLDEIRIATAYEIPTPAGRERIDQFPADAHRLEGCRPVWETLPGWREEITGVRGLADLPAAARRYIDRLQELLERPVAFVSLGPDRDQTIRLRG